MSLLKYTLSFSKEKSSDTSNNDFLFNDDKTVAEGLFPISSEEKFGPDRITILLFGNILKQLRS